MARDLSKHACDDHLETGKQSLCSEQLPLLSTHHNHQQQNPDLVVLALLCYWSDFTIMSHIKQTQQTNNKVAKASQTTNRIAKRDQTEVRSSIQSRSQTSARSVSTRTEVKQNGSTVSVIKSVSPRLHPDSTNILRRSLSKLRIKEAISPSKQKPSQAQREAQKERSAQQQRAPLQPISKIPQATAPNPSSTRIIGGPRLDKPVPTADTFVTSRADQPNSARQDLLHHNAIRQRDLPERRDERTSHFAALAKTQSPATDKKTADVRLKAMQLGIFKISEADLKERYQFLNEIGTYLLLRLTRCMLPCVRNNL